MIWPQPVQISLIDQAAIAGLPAFPKDAADAGRILYGCLSDFHFLPLCFSLFAQQPIPRQAYRQICQQDGRSLDPAAVRPGPQAPDCPQQEPARIKGHHPQAPPQIAKPPFPAIHPGLKPFIAQLEPQQAEDLHQEAAGRHQLRADHQQAKQAYKKPQSLARVGEQKPYSPVPIRLGVPYAGIGIRHGFLPQQQGIHADAKRPAQGHKVCTVRHGLPRFP